MAVVYTDAYKFGHAWISVERLDQQEKIILVFQSSGRFVLTDANMNGTNDVQFLQLFLLVRLLNYGQIFTPSFL